MDKADTTSGTMPNLFDDLVRDIERLQGSGFCGGQVILNHVRTQNDLKRFIEHYRHRRGKSFLETITFKQYFDLSPAEFEQCVEFGLIHYKQLEVKRAESKVEDLLNTGILTINGLPVFGRLRFTSTSNTQQIRVLASALESLAIKYETC